MPCLYTPETAKGKENIHLKPSIFTSPNNRLRSWLSPKPLIFSTDQIKKTNKQKNPTRCLCIMLMFIEIFLKTYHMQPIISLLLIGLFTIIIYPNYDFENIFKFTASKMNQQGVSSVIPQGHSSEVLLRACLLENVDMVPGCVLSIPQCCSPEVSVNFNKCILCFLKKNNYKTEIYARLLTG